MPEPFEEDLNRLERRAVVEPCDRARMWRRSYCVALNTIAALEHRISRLRRTQWDTPMTFFYPPTGGQRVENENNER